MEVLIMDQGCRLCVGNSTRSVNIVGHIRLKGPFVAARRLSSRRGRAVTIQGEGMW